MNKFGNTIKHFLIDNELTQQDLANSLGCTRQSINHLLNRNNISLDKMIEVADAIGCELQITLAPRTSEALKVAHSIVNTPPIKKVGDFSDLKTKEKSNKDY